MKKINSGELNQKIEIYRIMNASNGSGGTIPTETLYWSTFAKVTPLGSNQTLEANQEMLKDGFSFLVRYRKDKTITPEMIIKYRGGVLKITSAPLDYPYKEWVSFKAIWNNRPQGGE